MIRLKYQVAHQVKKNQALSKQNENLQKEVAILKQGHGIVEDLAREQMGMIKPHEKYYQFVKVKQTNAGKK